MVMMFSLYLYLKRRRKKFKFLLISLVFMILFIQILHKNKKTHQPKRVKRDTESPRTCVALFLILHFRVPQDAFISELARTRIKDNLAAYTNTSKQHFFLDDSISDNGLPQSMRDGSYYIRGSSEAQQDCGYVWGFDSQNREVLYDTCKEKSLKNSWKFCKLPHEIVKDLTTQGVAEIDQFCKPNLAAAWPLQDIDKCLSDQTTDVYEWVKSARALDKALMDDTISQVIGHPINAWQVLGLVVEYDEELLQTGFSLLSTTEVYSETMTSSQAVPTVTSDINKIQPSTPTINLYSESVKELPVTSPPKYTTVQTPLHGILEKQKHDDAVASSEYVTVTANPQQSSFTVHHGLDLENFTVDEKSYLDIVKKIYPEFFAATTEVAIDALRRTTQSHILEHTISSQVEDEGYSSGDMVDDEKFDVNANSLLTTSDPVTFATTTAGDIMNDLLSLRELVHKIYGIVLDNFPVPLNSLLTNMHNATDHDHVSLPKDNFEEAQKAVTDSKISLTEIGDITATTIPSAEDGEVHPLWRPTLETKYAITAPLTHQSFQNAGGKSTTVPLPTNLNAHTSSNSKVKMDFHTTETQSANEQDIIFSQVDNVAITERISSDQTLGTKFTQGKMSSTKMNWASPSSDMLSSGVNADFLSNFNGKSSEPYFEDTTLPSSRTTSHSEMHEHLMTMKLGTTSTYHSHHYSSSTSDSDGTDESEIGSGMSAEHAATDPENRNASNRFASSNLSDSMGDILGTSTTAINHADKSTLHTPQNFDQESSQESVSSVSTTSNGVNYVDQTITVDENGMSSYNQLQGNLKDKPTASPEVNMFSTIHQIKQFPTPTKLIPTSTLMSFQPSPTSSIHTDLDTARLIPDLSSPNSVFSEESSTHGMHYITKSTTQTQENIEINNNHIATSTSMLTERLDTKSETLKIATVNSRGVASTKPGRTSAPKLPVTNIREVDATVHNNSYRAPNFSTAQVDDGGESDDIEGVASKDTDLLHTETVDTLDTTTKSENFSVIPTAVNNVSNQVTKSSQEVPFSDKSDVTSFAKPTTEVSVVIHEITAPNEDNESSKTDTTTKSMYDIAISATNFAEHEFSGEKGTGTTHLMTTIKGSPEEKKLHVTTEAKDDSTRDSPDAITSLSGMQLSVGDTDIMVNQAVSEASVPLRSYSTSQNQLLVTKNATFETWLEKVQTTSDKVSTSEGFSGDQHSETRTSSNPLQNTRSSVLDTTIPARDQTTEKIDIEPVDFSSPVTVVVEDNSASDVFDNDTTNIPNITSDKIKIYPTTTVSVSTLRDISAEDGSTLAQTVTTGLLSSHMKFPSESTEENDLSRGGLDSSGRTPYTLQPPTISPTTGNLATVDSDGLLETSTHFVPDRSALATTVDSVESSVMVPESDKNVSSKTTVSHQATTPVEQFHGKNDNYSTQGQETTLPNKNDLLSTVSSTEHSLYKDAVTWTPTNHVESSGLSVTSSGSAVSAAMSNSLTESAVGLSTTSTSSTRLSGLTPSSLSSTMNSVTSDLSVQLTSTVETLDSSTASIISTTSASSERSAPLTTTSDLSVVATTSTIASVSSGIAEVVTTTVEMPDSTAASTHLTVSSVSQDLPEPLTSTIATSDVMVTSTDSNALPGLLSSSTIPFVSSGITKVVTSTVEMPDLTAASTHSTVSSVSQDLPEPLTSAIATSDVMVTPTDSNALPGLLSSSTIPFVSSTILSTPLTHSVGTSDPLPTTKGSVSLSGLTPSSTMSAVSSSVSTTLDGGVGTSNPSVASTDSRGSFSLSSPSIIPTGSSSSLLSSNISTSSPTTLSAPLSSPSTPLASTVGSSDILVTSMSLEAQSDILPASASSTAQSIIQVSSQKSTASYDQSQVPSKSTGSSDILTTSTILATTSSNVPKQNLSSTVQDETKWLEMTSTSTIAGDVFTTETISSSETSSSHILGSSTTNIQVPTATVAKPSMLDDILSIAETDRTTYSQTNEVTVINAASKNTMTTSGFIPIVNTPNKENLLDQQHLTTISNKITPGSTTEHTVVVVSPPDVNPTTLPVTKSMFATTPNSVSTHETSDEISESPGSSANMEISSRPATTIPLMNMVTPPIALTTSSIFQPDAYDPIMEVAGTVAGKLFQYKLPQSLQDKFDAEKSLITVNLTSVKTVHETNARLLTEEWLSYCTRWNALCGLPVATNGGDISQTSTFEISVITNHDASKSYTMTLHVSVYPMPPKNIQDYKVSTYFDVKYSNGKNESEIYAEYPVIFVEKLTSYLAIFDDSIEPSSINLLGFAKASKLRKKRNVYHTVKADWTVQDMNFSQFNNSLSHLIADHASMVTNYDFFMTMLPELIVGRNNISRIETINFKSKSGNRAFASLASNIPSNLGHVLPPILIGIFALACFIGLVLIRCRKRPTFFFVDRYFDKTYDIRKPVFLDDEIELDYFRPSKVRIINEDIERNDSLTGERSGRFVTTQNSDCITPSQGIDSANFESNTDNHSKASDDEGEDGYYSFSDFSFVIEKRKRSQLL